MNNNNLQDRVQSMLDGERKRRDIALKWISGIVELLVPVSEDLWGVDNYFGDYTTNISPDDKTIEMKYRWLYFRYKKHVTDYGDEEVGFYENTLNESNYGGDTIKSLRGEDFWEAVKAIIEWIPKVIYMIEGKEKYRLALLEKIRTED